MKRLLILAVALCTMSTVSAQNWLDALEKVATTAVDKATGGKLTELAILGEWNYAGPGVKLESDDTLSELGGAAIASGIEEKLTPLYQAVGIRPGACNFRFDKEGTFSAVLGRHTFNGTYVYNNENHAITLQFERTLGSPKEMTGHAYLSGTEMQLVFPSEKLMSLITTLGSKIPSLKSVTRSLEKFDSIAIGFNFNK